MLSPSPVNTSPLDAQLSVEYASVSNTDHADSSRLPPEENPWAEETTAAPSDTDPLLAGHVRESADLSQVISEGIVQAEEPTFDDPVADSTGQAEFRAYLSATKELIKLASPLSLARLGMALHGIANGMVVRNLSHNEIAAVPLAGASISEVLTLIQGIL